MLRRGLRASSPSGAAASKPMKARIANTIPLNTPLHSPSALPGLNGCRFMSPAFESSIQIANPAKITISNAPRITPAVVEMRTSRYVSRNTITVISSTQIHHCPS